MQKSTAKTESTILYIYIYIYIYIFLLGVYIYYLMLGFSWLLWLAAGHDLEPSSGCCCCYMQDLCSL
jgi:flagellar basal body-associated protein FliL